MWLLDMLFVLIVLVPILILAVLATKYLGGKAKNAMRGQHISIIETINLGLDKKIHLIKAGDQFVLVASTGKNMQFLTTVKLENYAEGTAESGNSSNFDFKNVFEKYLQNFNGSKRNKSNSIVNSSEELMESVEVDVFKNNLNRLRTITAKANKIAKIDGDDNTNEK
ncbi:MAG: flagellar biosynthetic protein FliO [Clostridia bacterium]|nr:flagellar biosynthetic protein FliO [Clostridia bacterium]